MVVYEFLIAVLKTTFTLLFIGLFLLVFYKFIILNLFSYWREWFKYKILRKPYDEKTIQYLADLNLKKESDVLKTELLRLGDSKKAREHAYLWRQIKKIK